MGTRGAVVACGRGCLPYATGTVVGMYGLPQLLEILLDEPLCALVVQNDVQRNGASEH